MQPALTAVNVLPLKINRRNISYPSKTSRAPKIRSSVAGVGVTRPCSMSQIYPRGYTGSVVYNFFDNLLPDNKPIRSRILRRFQISENHPFFILNAIGRDCVGALQICEPILNSNPQNMQYKKLSRKDIANILRSCTQSPLGMLPKNADFRISIADAQEKTALLFFNNKWCLPLEATPTSHILALPIGLVAQS